jgi:hypothetical protein
MWRDCHNGVVNMFVILLADSRFLGTKFSMSFIWRCKVLFRHLSGELLWAQIYVSEILGVFNII